VREFDGHEEKITEFISFSIVMEKVCHRQIFIIIIISYMLLVLFYLALVNTRQLFVVLYSHTGCCPGLLTYLALRSSGS